MTAETVRARGPVYQIPVGEALLTVRRRLTLSLESAARELGLSARHLSQIESGIRTPSPKLLETFESVYEIEMARLESRSWAERVPPRFDVETGTLWLGWLPIQTDVGDNEKLVRSLAAALRTMRSLGDHQPVYLRGSEFPVLGPLFDLDDLHLPFYFMRYLRLTWQEASWLYTALAQEVDRGIERRRMAAEANLHMAVARALV